LVVSDILHLSFIAAVSSSAVTMPVAAVSSVYLLPLPNPATPFVVS
jgi:hypothetical protein